MFGEHCGDATNRKVDHLPPLDIPLSRQRSPFRTYADTIFIASSQTRVNSYEAAGNFVLFTETKLEALNVASENAIAGDLKGRLRTRRRPLGHLSTSECFIIIVLTD